MFAALFSYSGVVVRVRVPLLATQVTPKLLSNHDCGLGPPNTVPTATTTTTTNTNTNNNDNNDNNYYY